MDMLIGTLPDVLWYWILLNALLGLIVGSFLNVFVLRHNTGVTILGRSSCFSCGRTLSPIDLVPVFSWLFLRGKCRTCGAHISIQYPLVEATTAVLFGLVAWSPLPIVTHILALIFVSLCVATVAYDMLHTIIPDAWSYGLALCALFITVSLSLAVPPQAGTLFAENVLWLLLSGPIVALPLVGLWLFSGGRWMGLGDGKLALSIGYLLGIFNGYIALMIAFVVGAVVSILVVIVFPRVRALLETVGITRFVSPHELGTMGREVPFGPFLVLGNLLTWFLLLHGHALLLF